jgi:hypothetical protein
MVVGKALAFRSRSSITGVVLRLLVQHLICIVDIKSLPGNNKHLLMVAISLLVGMWRVSFPHCGLCYGCVRMFEGNLSMRSTPTWPQVLEFSISNAVALR